MNEVNLKTLLAEVKSGQVEIDDALERLRQLPFENVEGFANLDHHRSMRCGFPEAVYGEGKTSDQLIKIINRLFEKNDRVLVTRLNAEVYESIKKEIPDAKYHVDAKCLVLRKRAVSEYKPGVFVLTAGTVDIPVAEEAALTAELMDNQVTRLYDVGVAGIHRLFSHLSLLQSASVIVVVAGMDGALPSVVSGLVDIPVIAVPTSVGYGASFNGVAALLTMLNSCANGVAVVNIDNGFGAGYLAGLINAQEKKVG